MFLASNSIKLDLNPANFFLDFQALQRRLVERWSNAGASSSSRGGGEEKREMEMRKMRESKKGKILTSEGTKQYSVSLII